MTLLRAMKLGAAVCFVIAVTWIAMTLMGAELAQLGWEEHFKPAIIMLVGIYVAIVLVILRVGQTFSFKETMIRRK
jgi:hypothetical protein